MNEKDIAEQAYKNGYEQALKEIERLQKQVDEKDQIIANAIVRIETTRQQTVKDTADKIFRQVLRLYQGLSKAERETMAFEWKLLDLAVEYGVEVE